MPEVPALGVRYQVAAVEQVGAGVLDAGVLGAGQRMAADEAGIVVGGDDLALGGADVGDHAVRGRSGQRLAHQRRQAADGHGHEHRLGVGDGGGDRAARAVQRAELRARARAPRARRRTRSPRRRGARAPPAPPSRRSTRRRGPRAASTDARRLGRAAARAHRVCQTVEHLDGGVPADAAVGDRLAVDERAGGSASSRSWRPATRKDSSITPTIDRCPAAICSATAAATAGWRSGCLPLLSWLRSIITRSGSELARSSSTARATSSAA